MSDHDDFGAFLIGFVVGGVVGAATALLLAPQSGEETRTLLKEKTIELRNNAAKTAESATAEARASYEKLAKEVKTRGGEMIEATKKAVAPRKKVTTETTS
jgi:gas vesicle protein